MGNSARHSSTQAPPFFHDVHGLAVEPARCDLVEEELDPERHHDDLASDDISAIPPDLVLRTRDWNGARFVTDPFAISQFVDELIFGTQTSNHGMMREEGREALVNRRHWRSHLANDATK